MKAAAVSSVGSPRHRGFLTRRMRDAFAGVGLRGIAVVVCVALMNALRRTVFGIAGDPHFGPARFVDPLATGLLVGFAMLFAVEAALKRYPRRGGKQYLAITTAILASCALAVLVKDVWEVAFEAVVLTAGLAQFFLSDWLRYAVLGGLVAGACLYFRAEAEGAAIAHQCAIDSERMAHEVAEARLRLLEAQIEPHFLFNTLATVKGLFETDPELGGRVLDNLMRYLSIALPQMRGAESTLGGEAALATAYLDIQRIRMGRRLSFDVAIPTPLLEARLMPFVLLTLIENAIKHGLNPLPEGGTLRVTARSAEAKLIVQVVDTGRGFAQAAGVGTGLANIRARLSLLYGRDASLTFSHNEPRGVAATIVVPLERSVGAFAQ